MTVKLGIKDLLKPECLAYMLEDKCLWMARVIAYPR